MLIDTMFARDMYQVYEINDDWLIAAALVATMHLCYWFTGDTDSVTPSVHQTFIGDTYSLTPSVHQTFMDDMDSLTPTV